MGYIGSAPAQQVLTGADIQDASIGLVDISSAAQDALGKIDYYGFKKTNGTGSQLEDLVITYTNGADNISVLVIKVLGIGVALPGDELVTMVPRRNQPDSLEIYKLKGRNNHSSAA